MLIDLHMYSIVREMKPGFTIEQWMSGMKMVVLKEKPKGKQEYHTNH